MNNCQTKISPSQGPLDILILSITNRNGLVLEYAITNRNGPNLHVVLLSLPLKQVSMEANCDVQAHPRQCK